MCFNNFIQEKNTNFQGVIASGYDTINISNMPSCSQNISQINNITSGLMQLMGIRIIQAADSTIYPNTSNIENFDMVDVRNTCNKACGEINLVHILILILIIVLLYLVFRKK